MRVFKTLVCCLLISALSTTVFAQQISNGYFIENNPLRQDYNPAFKPKTDYFVSLPVIGYTSFELGNNSLTIKDLVYNSNGQTVIFNQVNTENFFNTLQSTTVLQADAKINILAFGWRNKKDYLSFSIDQRVTANVGLPKDLFKLAFYGTPDIYKNSFNLSKFQTDISLYTEFGACYNKRISSNLTLGAKLKLLVGNMNISNTNSTLNIDANINEWTIKGSGSVNYSGGLPIIIDNQFHSVTIKANSGVLNFLNKPSGIGTGIDLGVNYKLNSDIVLSASLLDFGIINWFNNVSNINYNIDYKYDGIKQLNGSSVLSPGSIFSGTSLTDSLLNSLKASYKISQSAKSYFTSTRAKLNIGFEYKFYENNLSFGLLSHSELLNQTVIEEVTTSINAKPMKWFNASLSYSFLNGQFSTIGLGFGLRTGLVHWLFGADYFPLQLVNIPLSASGKNNLAVSYNSKVFNLHLGINIVLNKSTLKRMHIRTGLYGYDTDED